MYLINKVRSWWRRSVVVKLADQNSDVVLFRIDPGNGNKPQEIYLNRNNTFAAAWVVFNFLADKGNVITEVVITDPLEKDETEPRKRILIIPKWAHDQFIKQLACVVINDLHWDGHCPQPERHTAYR